MAIARKLRTLAGAGPRRQMMALEAGACLAAARVATGLLPFRIIAGWLGPFVPPAAAPAPFVRADHKRAAQEIGWAVRSVAAHAPFKAVCLQQALAAHAMLRRRGIPSVVRFGAGRGDAKPLDAHAWVDAAGVAVTGHPVAPHIAEIGCFTGRTPWPPPAPDAAHPPPRASAAGDAP
ncbi:lasso peptide biosynthesis B2 protein [Aquabacter spiritensis]|uniref:Transglutaminase superfamily protein n=1 Tax=Aquabacter spiritensis TaxID=933073 RepID=A0A4R3M7E0_9HYPH|nr:lasso peptide biosynthesis B2 protein [Aquabacter spiritensis]TCT07517.1 transglutaminase superfamily protein [Aquabacter spiritensis]